MKKVLLLIAVAAIAVIGIFAVSKAEKTPEPIIPETAGQSVHVSPTPAPPEKNIILDEVTNILILGLDNDNLPGLEEQGNSDGIMLVSINPSSEEIIFTSFLRDTRVRVKDSYYDKLTMVYHTGGVELLKKTFEENFNIPIDCYAMFNYLDIIDIVDSVGGVEVELDEQEIYFMDEKIKNLSTLSKTNYEDNRIAVDQAGPINLNGVQAAAYMRIRPADGNYDFGRTERARNVVSCIIRKLYGMSLSDMVEFANTLYAKTKTDISAEIMLSFAVSAEELKSYEQIMDRIPIDGAYTSLNDGSGSYIVPDFEINNKHLEESIYQGIH